jgi:bacterioferritin-associated ferredoxin
MIVCSCHGITDGDIRRAQGPDGPGGCPAGTSCGNCLPVVMAITEQCRSQAGPSEEFDDAARRPTPCAERSDLAPRG